MFFHLVSCFSHAEPSLKRHWSVFEADRESPHPHTVLNGDGKTRGQRTLPAEIIVFWHNMYDYCWSNKIRFDVPQILLAPTSSSFGAALSRVAGDDVFSVRYADMPILS